MLFWCYPQSLKVNEKYVNNSKRIGGGNQNAKYDQTDGASSTTPPILSPNISQPGIKGPCRLEAVIWEQTEKTPKAQSKWRKSILLLSPFALSSPILQAIPRPCWWRQWQWGVANAKNWGRGNFLFDQRTCDHSSAINTSLYLDQDLGSVAVSVQQSRINKTQLPGQTSKRRALEN